MNRTMISIKQISLTCEFFWLLFSFKSFSCFNFFFYKFKMWVFKKGIKYLLFYQNIQNKYLNNNLDAEQVIKSKHLRINLNTSFFKYVCCSRTLLILYIPKKESSANTTKWMSIWIFLKCT